MSPIFKEVFYLFMVVAIFHELHVAMRPVTFHEISKSARLMKEADKEAQNAFIKKHRAPLIWERLYSFWALLGLTTANWGYFLALLVLSFMVSRFRCRHWAFVLVDALLSITILVLLFIAHYHGIHYIKI
ncbi:hypothetical protein [Chitinophaga sp. YIM B06452]|uniref:hypothetical protein n=1 Tax=Chitinophaga sp. YIM B06452 TaxID=3082158 RepID=UPI0031FE90B0